jgi:Tol biopolymer transport system component
MTFRRVTTTKFAVLAVVGAAIAGGPLSPDSPVGAQITVTVPGCVVDPSDVVAWWPGENALTAEMGPDLAGSVPFTNGAVGRAMDFGGPTQTNLAATSGLATLTDALTFEAWIRPVITGQSQAIASRWSFVGGRNDDAYVLLIGPDGDVEFRTNDPSGRVSQRLRVPVQDITGLYDGNFHHIAATRSTTNLAIYLDGTQRATTATRGGPLNAAADTEFRLGSSTGRGNPFWYQGQLDEATIWRRALTATEINSIRALGDNAKSKCIFTDTAGLVGPGLQFPTEEGAADPVITPDGRYILFTSRASDLLPVVTDPLLQTPGIDLDLFGPTRDDLVLLDTKSTSATSDDTLELMSVDSSGLGGGLDSFWGTLTPNASHVVFSSLSNDLVLGDTLGGRDVFVRDRVQGTTWRASVRSDGSQPEYTATGLHNDSRDASISDDGRVVAFASTNRDLAPEANPVPGDTWQTYDIYVRDVSDPGPANHVTERITVGLGDTKADGSSSSPLLSPDGRYVWFSSAATNLVTGDTNGNADLFVHDRQTSTTTRLNVTAATGQALDADVELVDVTPNGRFVLFDTAASTVVPSDTNGLTDTFRLDALAAPSAAVKKVSPPLSPVSNGASFGGGISDDGRFVVFHTSASNLIANDTNSTSDMFVADMINRRVQRISTDTDRTQRAGSSSHPVVTADAAQVVYVYSDANQIRALWRVDLTFS